jgi:hypothetical protein
MKEMVQTRLTSGVVEGLQRLRRSDPFNGSESREDRIGERLVGPYWNRGDPVRHSGGLRQSGRSGSLRDAMARSPKISRLQLQQVHVQVGHMHVSRLGNRSRIAAIGPVTAMLGLVAATGNKWE